MNTCLVVTGYVVGMGIAAAKELAEMEIKKQMALLAIDCARELLLKPERVTDGKAMHKVEVKHSLRRVDPGQHKLTKKN